MPFSGDGRVLAFYFGMRGIIIKKLSTIHFPLSIARCGRKKLYLFNCISLRIQVFGLLVCWYIGSTVAVYGFLVSGLTDVKAVLLPDAVATCRDMA